MLCWLLLLEEEELLLMLLEHDRAGASAKRVPVTLLITLPVHVFWQVERTEEEEEGGRKKE